MCAAAPPTTCPAVPPPSIGYVPPHPPACARMPTELSKPTWFDLSKLFFVGAIWGGSFIFISLALTDFGPISIAAWRIAVAAVLLLLVSLLLRQAFPRTLREWKMISLVGLLNSAVPFFLINWGQQFISSAESALLMASGTFCALLLSHYVSDDERINWARGLGICVGFLGVVVLFIDGLLTAGLGLLAGQLAVVGAGCSYAVSSVLARRITHLPSISCSAATMLTAGAYMLPLAFLLEQPLPGDAGVSAIVSVLYLGMIGTAMAFVIRFTIIRANGAVFMSQVGYLVPVFGVFWSWLFLTATIGPQTWVTLALILLGIAITRHGS